MDGENANSEDCSKHFKISNDLDIESIRDRFVTGDWSKAALRNKSSEVIEDDDSVFADFEDLETGEKYESYHAENTTDATVQTTEDSTIEERRLKKLARRAQFDAEYPFDDVYCTLLFFPPSFSFMKRIKLGFCFFFFKCPIQILSILRQLWCKQKV